LPVNVPTQDEFATLESDVMDLDARIALLESRVTELENAATTPPPEPGRPEHPIVLPPWEPEPPEPEPEPAGAVTVHMGGVDYLYDPAAGADIGDYHDPDGRFVMSCIRVTRDDCPLLVDFRATDAWRCVVFEHSDPLNGSCPNLAYSVTIEDIEHQVADHWGNASWRWQSCPWPHPLTPLETLYERKLLPRHDGALACGKASGLTNVAAPVPPMSLCGFTPDMPGTG